ncbi:MAG: hypothetical protein CO094_05530 [Anaerolineae bacterium CG_4_9_14_3_um_filter_57_17]|nr:DnaD domain protein [bacterium]NCT20372.1 DnaD domain protein [bacterium]OIO87344.1 MAG: hypothetical protein AUK01_00480 [Anaerolineae bacterium CG2_30_57_67]PJB66999.1 MAG: hypothetical protein CO094_05530 [Anaerolineae bacterium CG_4_9_14_3_um_filter_57_17]
MSETPAFPGFTSSETFTQVPDALFRLMSQIRDADELKMALYVLWRIEHMQSAQRFLSRDEIASDAEWMSGCSAADLDSGLEKAVRRGILLRAGPDAGGLYVLNSPRGRVTAEALKKSAGGDSALLPQGFQHKSQIFGLYEQNIGPLTPMLADMLREAETEYPAEWIYEAFEIAVSRNKRSWNYVQAILKRWKQDGKDERKNSEDAGKNSQRYSNSQFSDFFDQD